MILLIVLSGIVLALLAEQQVNSVAFVPRSSKIQVLPAQNYSAQELSLRTEDGLAIRAFLMGTPEDDRFVLFFPGNYGSVTQRFGFAEEIRALGFGVLLMEYRGYGDSEGRPTEHGVYLDAEAALSYLVDTLLVPKARIVLYGRSLGSVVAVQLAVEGGFAGAVLVSPVSCASDVARAMGLGLLAPFVRRRFNTVDKVTGLDCPLVVFHGTLDEVLPAAMGRAVYEAACEPKELRLIDGAGHNDLIIVAADRFWIPFAEFLDRVAPPEY